MGAAVTWTTVEVFPQRGLAEVGGSALRSAGVPFRIVADDAGGVHVPMGAGGVELQVPADQAVRARTLLHLDEPPAVMPHALTSRARMRTDWLLLVVLAVVIAVGVLLVGLDAVRLNG